MVDESLMSRAMSTCFISGCRFFQFVDEAWFDGVVALVIVLNLLLIVMEPLGCVAIDTPTGQQ